MLTTLDLPPLTAEEAAHTATATACIVGEIAAAGGWIPFSRYMQLALYAPGLGYYSAGTQKFGRAGDFVTAPELTPVFAACVSRQVAEILDRLDGGEILELGAGSGVLAADLLTTLGARDRLPRRYRILEVSGELRARQQALIGERIPHLLDRVDWLDSLPASPWAGVVIANEVVDALPVERFRIDATGIVDVGVTVRDGALAWQERPASHETLDALRRIEGDLPEPLAAGATGELRELDGPWLRGVAGRLVRGALLIVDYGLPRRQLFHPDLAEGTLRCYFRHRQHGDALLHPGLTDITASVDFTGLAEAGVSAGLDVTGFATQAHFLMSLGLDRELAVRMEGLGAEGRAALGQAAGMLLLPGEMGERFKVLALTRGIEGPLSGFAFRDLAATL